MKIHDGFTFTTGSLSDLENRLYGQRLAFERAEDRFDVHAMNIACAKADYYQRQIDKLKGATNENR